MMKFALTIITCLPAWLNFAQDNNSLPLAKKLTTFPFITLSGGTVIVKAQLDDFRDTLNFIFDTGSGGISLDSTTVAQHNIAIQKTNRTIKGIGGMRALDFAYDHCLKFSNLFTNHLDFHINNYDVLTSSYGIRIDGVIGYSFMSKYIVKIDYDDHIITIYSKGKFKYPKAGVMMQPTMLGLPTTEHLIADTTSITTNFIFDTGAGINMLLSSNLVNDSLVIPKKRKRFLTQAEGLGGKKNMELTFIKKIKIGKYKFRFVPIYIFNDEYNVTNYPLTGGIIGNDLLRRFNVIINYNENKIHLRPNTHFAEDFDYGYTGLFFYQNNNQIIVEDVVEGSPAHKAGFEVNDIIIAVDNNFSKDIQLYKQTLQNAGSTVKVLIVRNGQPQMLSVEVLHILN